MPYENFLFAPDQGKGRTWCSTRAATAWPSADQHIAALLESAAANAKSGIVLGIAKVGLRCWSLQGQVGDRRDWTSAYIVAHSFIVITQTARPTQLLPSRRRGRARLPEAAPGMYHATSPTECRYEAASVKVQVYFFAVQGIPQVASDLLALHWPP
jgi:hypothetical protein